MFEIFVLYQYICIILILRLEFECQIDSYMIRQFDDSYAHSIP